ncbi:Kcnb2, partial [Symbiodinium pilosum]
MGLQGVEARLDRLSAQMDLCLAEVMSWRGLAAQPETRTAVEAAAAENAASTVDTFKLLHASDRRESETSGDKSLAASSTTSDDRRGSNGDAVNKYQSRQMLPVRSMDLKVAWKLHARELTRELGELSESDQQMQPLLRLVYRSRADYVWELLDDPNSSIWAWWICLFLKLLVTVSVLISNLEAVKPPLMETTLVAILQTSFDAVFLLEFLGRISSAPSKKAYLMDSLNWADLLSALGLPLRACLGF